MGSSKVARLWRHWFPSSFFFLLVIRPATYAQNNAASNPHGGGQDRVGNIAPSPAAAQKPSSFPFGPSVAVIAGILTTIFSIMSVFLLYAKHCRGGNGAAGSGGGAQPQPPSSTVRKNSGIDRAVIESLPVFRFADLSGHKDGLECAVCLNRFEAREVLRLLPKCKHGFHVECVDTWLDAHSTCPLCRHRVHQEDILLLMRDFNPYPNRQPQTPPTLLSTIDNINNNDDDDDGSESAAIHRIFGRNSAAGEKSSDSDILQIILHNADTAPAARSHQTQSSEADGSRKDRQLLTRRVASSSVATGRQQQGRRLEHRIVVSDAGGRESEGEGEGPPRERWSDGQASDLLYLRRSEMITSNGLSRPSSGSRKDGRSVIMGRCVSEISGLSRFTNRGGSGGSGSDNNCINSGANRGRHPQQRQAAAVVSRWKAWTSRSLPAVRVGEAVIQV